MPDIYVLMGQFYGGFMAGVRGTGVAWVRVKEFDNSPRVIIMEWHVRNIGILRIEVDGFKLIKVKSAYELGYERGREAVEQAREQGHE